jgi:triacylglycerol lipase
LRRAASFANLGPGLIAGIAAALILLVVAGSAAAWWWRARRRKLRPVRREAKLRHPVLLAHGVMGFDEIGVAGLRQSYFRGVPEALEKLGAQVHLVKVPAVGSVAQRAEALAQAVRSLDAERVNVIAHSMGGLDARYAISSLGLSTKVASLTTIGSPHRGTPIADLGTSVFGDKLGLLKVLAKIGFDLSAFYDLTTARMEAFNREVADVKGISYGCYLAHLPKGPRGTARVLWPAYRYLLRAAGENDGLVPTASQSWGEVLGRIEADHWGQIGWSTSFDAPGFYEQVIRELRGRGL